MHFVIHTDLHCYFIYVYRPQGNSKIRDNTTEELDHLKIKAKTHTGACRHYCTWEQPASQNMQEALVLRLCACICVAVCQNSPAFVSREHRIKTWQYWKNAMSTFFWSHLDLLKQGMSQIEKDQYKGKLLFQMYLC